MRSPIKGLIATLLMSQACRPVTPTSSVSIREPANTPTTELDWKDCADAPGLRCLTLDMPRSHSAPQRGSLKVTFALRPAAKQRQASLLVIGGGPGNNVISQIDQWLPSLDPRLRDHFDIISFDLRGAFRSGGYDCPVAASHWYKTPQTARTETLAGELRQAAQQFAAACAEEIPLRGEDYQSLNSVEAAMDIEWARVRLGVDRWSIYAYSYGTQLAQHYAWRYPQSIDRMVMDGSVDLETEALDYDDELSRTQDQVLKTILTACATAPECAARFRTSAIAAYERAALLMSEPQSTSEFTTASQDLAWDFEAAVTASLANATSRDGLVTMLAEFDQEGDTATLRNFVYPDYAAIPDTAATKTVTHAHGIYHTFICHDYGRHGDSAASREDIFRRQIQRSEQAPRYLRGSAYADLPCLFWESAPATRSKPAPHPLPFPVLLLAATFDTAVPYAQSQRVAAQLGASTLITADGGHHLLFGNGDSCIDEPVVQFLLRGEIPAEHARWCSNLR